MLKEVVLTWHEVSMAAHVGCQRHIRAMSKRLKDRYGFKDDGWTIHINGCLGELAVAKALNRYWDGSVDTFKSAADVGPLHVRTRSSHDFELIVRSDDPDDGVFVLVTGQAPIFRVRGWIMGREAKNKLWLKAHGGRDPAYFAPHSSLRDVSELATKIL